MDMGIKGRAAVVTGGSKGIGRAIALGLAAEGAAVAICARNEKDLRAAERDIAAFGGKTFAAVSDVEDSVALASFLDEAHDRLGGIDILINNVSAGGGGGDMAAWEKNFRLDLLASVRASNHVIPFMRQAGGGNIVFISSVSGLEGGWPMPYSAAKAALVSYAKNLSISLAKDRIRVNTLAPGSIEFPNGSWDQARRHNPDFYQATLDTIPWGRLGTPEEVANAAVFLVSERASWVTGVCLSVDGGQYKSNR